MKVISWNLKRATENSESWKVLLDLKPDIALLQEVVSISDYIKDLYDIKFCKAITKTGGEQRFGTAILVKGKIVGELPLFSEHELANKELKRFAGNIVSCIIEPRGYRKINAVSVHSPAWPINTSEYNSIDVSKIKLKNNPKLWATEILWSALKSANLADTPWLVGGDLNCSETFDLTFSSGNREVLDRMNALGFTECLRASKGELIPTFRNASDKKVVHQIDHLFVTDFLASKLKDCDTGNSLGIFEKSISDHLPIIADFML